MTLKEIITANPDGFTLDVRSQTLNPMNTGYYVSVTNNIVRDLEAWDDKAFLKMFNLLDSITPISLFIGGWRAVQASKYYIDVTAWVRTKRAAIQLAKTYSQIAIYDCKKNETIYFVK